MKRHDCPTMEGALDCYAIWETGTDKAGYDYHMILRRAKWDDPHATCEEKWGVCIRLHWCPFCGAKL